MASYDRDYEEQLEKLKDCLKDAEAKAVSGFYENKYPEFSQGMPTNELQELLTAEEVNGLINRLKDAEEILDRAIYWFEEPKAMSDAWTYFEKYKIKTQEIKEK